MNPHPCDSYQEAMSSLSDEGLPFPPELLEHTYSCSECADFLRCCGDIQQTLSSSLPSAADQLREKILQLPAIVPVRPRIPYASLSAAAAILISAAWWFSREIPNVPHNQPVVQDQTQETEMEIAALKEDFGSALVHLAEPLSVFDSLARP